ncbi:MAG: UvrD-helicase domain-containing protein [Parasutterella sp.]
MQSITESLNKQQAQAVTAEPKSALILAGAGSGKTRVLTSRIAYLLQQNMAHPSERLAVTFTNKAAKEMLARLQNMIPINPRVMWVGTFHGLCNRLLRLHHQEAGLPATFAILDMERPARRDQTRDEAQTALIRKSSSLVKCKLHQSLQRRRQARL